MAVNANDFRTENSNHKKLAGVHFDNKLVLIIIYQRWVKKPVERYMLLLGN